MCHRERILLFLITSGTICLPLEKALRDHPKSSSCKAKRNPKLNAANIISCVFINRQLEHLYRMQHQRDFWTGDKDLHSCKIPEFYWRNDRIGRINLFAHRKLVFMRNKFYPWNISCTSSNQHWIQCEMGIFHPIYHQQKQWMGGGNDWGIL